VIVATAPVGCEDYRKELAQALKSELKEEVLMIDEPLACGCGEQVLEEKAKVVLIVDFGASTINTLLFSGDLSKITILSKGERAEFIGGSTIDLWIAQWVCEKIGIAYDENNLALIELCESAKIALSDKTETVINYNNQAIVITREDLEVILDDKGFYVRIDRIFDFVLLSAEKYGYKKDNIDAVILTGGSSLIPSFKDKIADIFPLLRSENKIYHENPYGAVAYGASLYGTKEVYERSLKYGYVVECLNSNNERSYEMLFKMGENYPVEKTIKIRPANTLSALQNEIQLILHQIDGRYIDWHWVQNNGRQVRKQVVKPEYKPEYAFITLAPMPHHQEITLQLDKEGVLNIKQQDNRFIRLDKKVFQ
jgi:molecular chaperone DnaK (HSP70)